MFPNQMSMTITAGRAKDTPAPNAHTSLPERHTAKNITARNKYWVLVGIDVVEKMCAVVSFPLWVIPQLQLEVASAIHIFIAEYNLCDQAWIMIFHDLLSLLGRII